MSSGARDLLNLDAAPATAPPLSTTERWNGMWRRLWSESGYQCPHVAADASVPLVLHRGRRRTYCLECVPAEWRADLDTPLRWVDLLGLRCDGCGEHMRGLTDCHRAIRTNGNAHAELRLCTACADDFKEMN